MITYRVRQDNTSWSRYPKHFFAHSVNLRTVETSELAAIIQSNCSVKRSDVMAVLIELGETVQQLLIPMMEKPDIAVCTEYSPDEEKAVITVRYGGEKADITTKEEMLALTVLRGMAESIQYSYHPEDDLKNRITLVFS